MGGFTKIQLRDTSEENIDKCNQELREFGLRKDISFNSEKSIREEWEFYQNDSPEDRRKYYHNFPQDITEYSEFRKHWLAHPFVRPIGALTFDCYFGRTSTRAMHAIARWLLLSLDEVKHVEGSYSTFVERCGYKARTKQKLLMSLD